MDTKAGKKFLPVFYVYTLDILQDKETELQSVNEVKELPENFTNWLENNADRIEQSKSLPYFIRDNRDVVDRVVNEYKTRNEKERRWYKEHAKEVNEIFRRRREEARAKWAAEEAARNTIDTFEEIGKKWQIADGTTEDKYNACEMAQKFGLSSFKDEIDALLKEYGLDANKSWIRIHGENRFSFSLRSDDGKFQMSRLFTKTIDGIECEHQKLKVPEELQGKGITKELFKKLVPRYERIGVDNITICANMNIGGYAWAKYGFCAESRNDALYVCNRVIKEYRSDAEKIVLDWYNANGYKPFPMKLLAEHPWEKTQ